MKTALNLSKYGFLVLALISLAACTSTRMVATAWSDLEVAHPRTEKLLIVGATDNSENRAMFEKALATELEHKGVNTIRSTTVMPVLENFDTGTILETAARQGIDYAMVTRVVEIGTKQTRIPEYNPILFAYESGGNIYSGANRYVRTRVTTEKYVKLETKLYDTRTEKLVWSAVSETVKPDGAITAQDVIGSVSTAVSEQLQPSNARG